MDVVYAALYIDDNLLVGYVKSIDEAIAALKENWLVLKIVKGYRTMSLEVRFAGNKKQAWLGQSHLIENLEKVQSHKHHRHKIFAC